MKASVALACVFAAMASATRVMDLAATQPQESAAEIAADTRTVHFVNKSGKTINYRKFTGSKPGDKGTPGSVRNGATASFNAAGAAQVIKASFGDPTKNPVYQFEWTLDSKANTITADLSGKDSNTIFNGYKRSLLWHKTQEGVNARNGGCHNSVCNKGQTGPPCEYRTDHDLDSGTPTCPLSIEGSGTILTFQVSQ